MKTPPLYRITPTDNGGMLIEPVEGMQGPEQGLVGESRSDSETGPAEEAKPGERGVGEIALAPELQRHLERKIKEARGHWVDARENSHHWKAIECGAIHDALVNLRDDFERIAKERSDLANDQADTRHE